MPKIELPYHTLPFPVFTIDNNFNVLKSSEVVIRNFPRVENFLEIVDRKNHLKLKNALIKNKNKIELNLLGIHNQPILYDVYLQKAKSEMTFLYCIKKQPRSQHINSVKKSKEKRMEKEILSIQESMDELIFTNWKMENDSLLHNESARSNKFANSIADELQGSLLSLRGYMQLVKPQLEGFDEINEVNGALQEINRANNLINQYISTTNTTKLIKEHVNIQHLISECVASFTPEAEKINCQIHYMKKEILPAIYIDAKQIKQVILNILRNALDSIKQSKTIENGLIEITTKVESNCIIISIEENGSQIKEVLEKNTIKASNPQTKQKVKSLSLSLKIMKQHDGTIDQVTSGENGSTFLLKLPLS
ncbi:ATP-binding protein [Bacillus alkalisoli]|uniref:ATP-binding protein n=1 Tax=Bacillus alkalisoli TaxID=2011008 RepID=UPI0012FF28A2|nr:ATP-binding protein [Bacillus alkalisoli]